MSAENRKRPAKLIKTRLRFYRTSEALQLWSEVEMLEYRARASLPAHPYEELTTQEAVSAFESLLLTMPVLESAVQKWGFIYWAINKDKSWVSDRINSSRIVKETGISFQTNGTTCQGCQKHYSPKTNCSGCPLAYFTGEGCSYFYPDWVASGDPTDMYKAVLKAYLHSRNPKGEPKCYPVL